MEDQRVADYFIVAGLEENPTPLKATDETEAYARKAVKDPITDLAVINRTAGEEVPSGYSCVEQTPSGFQANLNFGSFRCAQLMLCYRRGRDKAPLVHIGVFFEGRDRLLPHCELVRETPHGRCANVNNASSSKTYIYYKRAVPTQSTPTDLVVTDVCVVIKDEKAPHTFWKISDRNLNNALMGADVFLCYKKAMINRNYLMYQPGLLFRYPVQDDASLSLPDDVSLFSMPMGASLEAWPKGTNLPRPVFSKFVLTVSGNHSQVFNGGSKMVQKLYGAALSFYESFPKDKLKADQLDKLLADVPEEEAEEYIFYSNKSICLLSRWPFFEAFQTFLQHILAMAVSTVSHCVPIEKVILHLFHEVPFPCPNRPKVLIQLPSGFLPIPLTRPDDSPIPSNGSSFSTVVKNLTAENCANLLLLSLLEQKICLHSLRPDVLTAVAESVTSMIFPFVWQCPYVPLCPLGLCGLLHAPVPFIVGVDSRYFDLYEPPLDVIYVDLDTGSIDLPTDKRDLNLKMMPKKATKALIEKLEKIISKMLKEAASLSIEKKCPKTPTAVPGEREFKNRFRTQQFDAEIQEVFLHFMVSIMKGYRNFLKPMVSAPTAGSTDPASLFDVEGFLKSRDKTYQKFYEIFTRTQQFIRFIEERSIMSDREASYSMAFFDHCVERLEKEGHNADIRLIETDGNLGDHTVYLPPLEADKSGEKFTYGQGFPCLRLDLFKEAPPRDSQDVNTVPDSTRSTVSAGDLATSRTKQEAKSSQIIAQHVNQRPKQWAKYLVSTGYAVWFMTLPSFVAASNSPSRSLRAAFETLKRMLTARIQPADEVCYRIMIQLCGQYSQPALAVKVLFEMKNNQIQPDAVTYGYYNKVVYESHWPSVAHSPEMLWMKVRHVMRGVYLFQRAGQMRRERLQDREDQVDAHCASEADSTNHAETEAVTAVVENKRDTGGSSDTGFFSLEHEEKRNSMASLTSGEFLASIAELKNKTEVSTEASTLDDALVDPQGVAGGIVRRSRISSTATIPKSDFCSAGLLMVGGNGKLNDEAFAGLEAVRGADKPPQSFHRRHRSLNEDPRSKKSPRHRRRHLSTSGVLGEFSSSGKHNLRWKREEVTTVSLSTLPTATQRVATPITVMVYGTVEVLDEHVKTIELPSPDPGDFDSEEERDKMEMKRRLGKSLSVPREVDASDSTGDVTPRLPHSTSSDFTAAASNALPKLGAFLRNTKSYSSIRKLWNSGDKRKGPESPTMEVPPSAVPLPSTPEADSSPLAKSGAALVSGVKSVTSALSKKFEEMATTLTTASPASYAPSRAGSSLRDIPGSLNFDYSLEEFEDGQALSPDDDEDEYRGEAVDGPNGRRNFHFPTYVWSPKHSSGRPEGGSVSPTVLVHADVFSVVLCQQCETVVYDEEIMAGWFPDESNLNTKCPYCATNFLPELSIALFEHWQDASHSDVSERTSNCDCPFLGTLKSTRTSSLLIENTDGDNHQSRTPLPSPDVTLTPHTPLDSGSGDAEVPEPPVLPSGGQEHCLPGDSLPVSGAEDALKEPLSRSSSSYGPISVCRLKRRIKVPYLSPLVLRKELETLIANEGAVRLIDPAFSTEHVIIYWNLVWYCERLTLPQNLTGLLIDEEGSKILSQLGHSTSLASRSRFVSISCHWDDPFISSEYKRSRPMYLLFGSHPNSQSSNLDALGLDSENPEISHNLMVQMLMKIRDESNLLTPMKTFLHEEQKRLHANDARHRSLYRELLFLTVHALDNEHIDKLAFDKVYKTSFNELRKDGDLIGTLQADDRPPSLTASWCRHAFRPLQL